MVSVDDNSLFQIPIPLSHLAVNYREYDRELSGHVSLIGRVKSHPDVAEGHYPELYKLYFPQRSSDI
jgi:hypothetical protein